MLRHIILFGSLFTLLTACGGGGGGPSTPLPTVQSSLSNSSLANSFSSNSVSSSSLSSSPLSSSSLSSNPSSRSSLSSSLLSSNPSSRSSLSSSLLSSNSSSRSFLSSSSLSSNSSSRSSLSSSSLSSNSSNSSSSSSVNPCNNTSGTIFSECLNAAYGFIIGSQYQPTFIEYIESAIGEQVQWSIVDSNSTHNKVLDISFSDNNRKGQIVIGYPDNNQSTQDQSQFQTGALQFDLRVLNFGDAYNAQAGGAVFVARMDCVWPCTAHETEIVIPTLETWTRVNLPISDLIASGLDVSQISASLVLVPRGDQANLHIQLDNVQLSKGGAVVAGPKVLFKEDFNNKTIPQWQLTKPAGNATAYANNNYGFGALIGINWLTSNDVLRFENTLDQTIDITNKQASFQINCWANANMNFSFAMVSTDVNGVTETTTQNYAMTLSTEKWYQVSANFGGIFDTGFDAKHIRTIGLQFNYLSSGSNTTNCQVDTIRITE